MGGNRLGEAISGAWRGKLVHALRHSMYWKFMLSPLVCGDTVLWTNRCRLCRSRGSCRAEHLPMASRHDG
jgi:hypothetical protein